MRNEKSYLMNQVNAYEAIRKIKVGEPEMRAYPDPRPDLSLWAVIERRNQALEALRKLQKN